jgi:hypothetical protein
MGYTGPHHGKKLTGFHMQRDIRECESVFVIRSAERLTNAAKPQVSANPRYLGHCHPVG